ncbi:NuA4 histone H4 acetyltransferase complex and the SWR1 complex subunit [Bonamia ostreae]|uniref:NuA4 histone H4 acetyltransferase complex and the SWR1 complex subunit n=1 Tax=Bonamia ostreae TaxID=126728 RepID=A0ABV2AEF0_9EUKA
MERSDQSANFGFLESDYRNKVEKPFVYGSIAFWQGKKARQEKSHKWFVYVRGKQNEDLGLIIERVEFTLHTSFENPVRVIKRAPFVVEEYGWGEFGIGIRVFFRDKGFPPINLLHNLKLFTKNIPSRKPVLSEKLDAFVFFDPPENLIKAISDCEQKILKNPDLDEHFQENTRGFSLTEEREVKRIAKDLKMVLREISSTNDQLLILKDKEKLYKTKAEKNK